MKDKVFDNNQVSIAGEVVSEFTYSHNIFGEGFYTVDIMVSRLSNSYDKIPLMVSERLMDVTESYVGKKVEVAGQFRSYNRHEENRNRLVLSVFAREIPIMFIWTAISAKNQSTGKHLWEERLQICCWL